MNAIKNKFKLAEDKKSELPNSATKITNKEQFYRQAFSRNVGILSETQQLELSNTRVAIPGLGGVGGAHLQTLARLGVGGFHLADFDSFEVANFNRQVGARSSTLGKDKIEVASTDALDINPFLEIKRFNAGINKDNIDEFLSGVDIVVDSLDIFALETRRLLFSTAREKGIPVITTGPLAFTAPMLIFMPNSMTFDEYFGLSDDMSPDEMLLSFQIGLAPNLKYLSQFIPGSISYEKKAGPSLGLTCSLAVSMAATEVIRIIFNKKGIRAAPYYVQFDLLNQKIRKGYLPWGNRNPIQKIKYLIAKRKFLTTKKNRK